MLSPSTRNPIVSTFKEEEFVLTPRNPYRLWKQRHPKGRVVCQHYHDALEILVNVDMHGSTIIEGKAFRLDEHPVMVVAPRIIHGHRVERSRGYVLVFQIGLAPMAEYFDIETLFRLDSRQSPANLPFVSSHYRALDPLLHRLLEREEGTLLDRLALIVDIFRVLSKETMPARPRPGYVDTIRAIIDWTAAHFAEPITLEQAAEVVHLSRFHFARHFKRATGTSYFTYVNQVRLDNARASLQRGKTVTEACLLSGFRNVSYFSQQFKKHFGVKPSAVRSS
ncbi:MAG: helix-turn-helix domain-containing protein [Chitinivibrionales bacterium]|nr:helix-turn-helix domain-containing protein [Chitinivibrionales bacterium]